jgi:hypothetical protein
MIPEFSAAVSTLSGSVGLLKTLLNTTRDEAVRTAIFDIQNELLSLQQKLFDANARFDEQSEKVKALQKQLDERDQSDEEAKKYPLFHPAEGMTVCKLLPEHNAARFGSAPAVLATARFPSYRSRLLETRITIATPAASTSYQPTRAPHIEASAAIEFDSKYPRTCSASAYIITTSGACRRIPRAQVAKLYGLSSSICVWLIPGKNTSIGDSAVRILFEEASKEFKML